MLSLAQIDFVEGAIADTPDCCFSLAGFAAESFRQAIERPHFGDTYAALLIIAASCS